MDKEGCMNRSCLSKNLSFPYLPCTVNASGVVVMEKDLAVVV